MTRRVFTSASYGRVHGASLAPPERSDATLWVFPLSQIHAEIRLRQFEGLGGSTQSPNGTLPGFHETRAEDADRILMAAARVYEIERTLAEAKEHLDRVLTTAHAMGSAVRFAEFDGRGWAWAHGKRVSRVHWYENFSAVCGAKGKPDRPNPMGTEFHGDKTFGCMKCQALRAGKGRW